MAKFLAHPNAVNDPLFIVVGSTLETLATDPNATNKALERLGADIVDARPVRLAEHLNGGFCKGQKAKSSFTSFGFDQGHPIGKYGKDCI